METSFRHNSEKAARTSLNQLNDDILLRIFDQLDYDDKIRLTRTCRRWRQLIGSQLRHVKALRLGQFLQGAYQVTSGLNLRCREHHGERKYSHRRETGSLFNEHLFELPAELETRCYSVSRYDYLHRALKHSYLSVTMLSLGQVHITYRLLLVLTNNLDNLEHLELISCASRLLDTANNRLMSDHPEDWKSGVRGIRANGQIADENLSSLESFHRGERECMIDKVRNSILTTNIMYNQNADEQANVSERLTRSTFARNCNLIREAKKQGQWSKMMHLLVKDCGLMNEFTLSLILSLTSQSLAHLEVEKSQYLTGEFLNYCGPRLKVLRLKECPSIRHPFVDDLVKIRQLLGSNIRLCTPHDQEESYSTSSPKLIHSLSSAAPFAIIFSN